MRYIVKLASPPTFEEWKIAYNPTAWASLQNAPLHPEEGIIYYSKQDLREALLTEQGFICCYCQRQIENTEHTVIEHWYPRNGDDRVQGAAKTFEYQNLMAACEGGGMSSYPVWCDKSKGANLIALSPLQPDIESRFKYELVSDNEVEILQASELDLEAIKTLRILNLNTPFLTKRRGKSIAGLIFKDPEGNELLASADAADLLSNFEAQTRTTPIGRFSEYHAVKIHFLRLISSVQSTMTKTKPFGDFGVLEGTIYLVLPP